MKLSAPKKTLGSWPFQIKASQNQSKPNNPTFFPVFSWSNPRLLSCLLPNYPTLFGLKAKPNNRHKGNKTISPSHRLTKASPIQQRLRKPPQRCIFSLIKAKQLFLGFAARARTRHNYLKIRLLLARARARREPEKKIIKFSHSLNKKTNLFLIFLSAAILRDISHSA